MTIIKEPKIKLPTAHPYLAELVSSNGGSRIGRIRLRLG